MVKLKYVSSVGLLLAINAIKTPQPVWINASARNITVPSGPIYDLTLVDFKSVTFDTNPYLERLTLKGGAGVYFNCNALRQTPWVTLLDVRGVTLLNPHALFDHPHLERLVIDDDTTFDEISTNEMYTTFQGTLDHRP